MDLISLVKTLVEESARCPERQAKIKAHHEGKEAAWNAGIEKAKGRGGSTFGTTDTGYMRVVKRKLE